MLYMVLKCNKFKANVLYFEVVVSYLFPAPLVEGVVGFLVWFGFFKSGYAGICVYASTSINHLSKSLSAAWKPKYLKLI